MPHVLELPESLFVALEAAATDRGKTPIEWIAEQLAIHKVETEGRAVKKPTNMAELFAEHIGSVNRVPSSALRETDSLSENIGERLTDHLLEKRDRGHL